MAELNGYNLSKGFYGYAGANYGKVKPVHAALYFWAVEVWNQLGQPKEFGLPAKEAMHHIGVGRHEAFSAALKDLTEWKFIAIKQPSINQYKANVIAICPPQNARSTARTTARGSAKGTEQGNGDSTAQGNANVIEPLNLRTLELNELLNNKEFELLLKERLLGEKIEIGLLEYLQYRTGKKLPFSGLAAKKLFNKVADWKTKYTEAQILETIDKTITSGAWTDIYEPKTQSNGRNQNSSTGLKPNRELSETKDYGFGGGGSI